MQDEPSRTALRETLLVARFADRRSRLLPVLADERGSDRYQWQLRDSAAGKYLVPADTPPEPARSAAFRRIVSENYDYRCAASGWRIILPEGRAMVEAAHLVASIDRSGREWKKLRREVIRYSPFREHRK